LPLELKQVGYQLTPNPTTGIFIIRATNLEGIQVVNAGGGLIRILRYKGNAPSVIPVDITHLGPGVYYVRLKYSNKTVINKILKVN
jgi:hypothetical protein